MKRLLASAATGLFLVAGTGSEGAAQTPSLFDLGLYGGLQYTSDWFEIGDEGYKTGFGPIFGAQATFWATPAIGVRVHGGYFPTGLPENDDESVSEDDYPNNNYLADLNLAFRPFMASTSRMMSSMYLFLGGGAAWANVAGDPTEDVEGGAGGVGPEEDPGQHHEVEGGEGGQDVVGAERPPAVGGGAPPRGDQQQDRQ